MKSSRAYRIALSLLPLSILASASPAVALSPTSHFNDWSLFTFKKSGKLQCYIASEPSQKRGNYSKRDEPYLLVSYKSRALDEVSVSAGFTFQPNSEATLSINKRSYSLFTKDNLAWAYDAATDIKLVEEMQNGISLQVTSTSKKGTQAIDTYSLNGFAAAYKHMKEQCK